MDDNITKTPDSIVANGSNVIQAIGMDAPEMTARFSDPAGNII